MKYDLNGDRKRKHNTLYLNLEVNHGKVKMCTSI